MKFKAPWALLVLLPLILVMFQAYRSMLKGRYSPALKTPWEKLWRVRDNMTRIPPRFLQLLGYFVGALFLIVALARPQTSFQKVKRTAEGIDIMLVLDISASMRVEDFRDTNRFDLAIQVLNEFVDMRTSDRIGLATFSGEAVTLAPPTLDYGLIHQQLDAIQIGDLKDGTAIGEGLATAVARLTGSRAKTKIVVLVTDGDNNMGQIDPMTAGEMAKGYGIKVYSIAIGKEGRVRMPFVQKDLFGRSYRTYQYFDSSINPELLRQISAATGGKFYRVQDDPAAFREVFRDIDKLERTVVISSEQVKYNERYQIFLQIGILILCLTWALQQTLLRVYP